MAPTLPPIVVSQVTTLAIPSTPIPVKYDSLDRIFTLPEVDPLDKGGPPPKSWRPVYREIKTIGGGSWKATTWISEGEVAVPAKPPADFKLAVNTGLYGTGGASGAAGIGAAAQGLMGLSSSALGLGTGVNTAGTTPGLAPVKQRIKKVKSETTLGGGSGAMTPASTTGGKKKNVAPSTTGGKKGKKGTGTPAGVATPVVMDPPLVSISRAVSDVDSEMRDL